MQIRARPAPGFLSRAYADEVLLAGLHRGETDRLTGTGATIWLALVHGCTLDEIARLLGEAFGAEPRELEPQIESFVLDLETRGWVEVTE